MIGQGLLDNYGEAIVRKAVSLALQGDKPTLRTLLGHVLGRKDAPVKTGPLRMGTVDELSQTFDRILKKVSSGQLTIAQGQAIAALIEDRRRVIETQEMETQVRALERHYKEEQERTEKVA
jgi:hypothetical protein